MTGVSRSLRLAGALLVLAAVAGACTSGSRPHAAATSSSDATTARGAVIKTFSPYAATGTLAVPVADQLSGSCWTGSIAVPKAGVYRCLVDNTIYDPCFAPPGETTPTTVACVPDPWSSAHVVTLTEPLPAPRSTSAADNPWALLLANAAHCVAATGTVPVVAGVPLNYLCGAGMAAGLISRDPARMEVKYGSESGGTLTPVAVATAWRG
jgi:hypothetical protein